MGRLIWVPSQDLVERGPFLVWSGLRQAASLLGAWVLHDLMAVDLVFEYQELGHFVLGACATL